VLRAALRQKDAESPTVTMEDFEAALDVVRPTSMAESTLEVAQVTLDEVGFNVTLARMSSTK